MIKYLLIFFFLFVAVTVFFIVKTMQYPSKIRKAEELLTIGDLAKASDIIKAILDKKKDYAPARYLRAQILIKQKQYLMAISELNSILSIPEYSKHIKELDIHYQLAFLYGETKSWQKEVEEYKVILSFNSDDLKANHRLGHALYRQKDYKKVREYLTKAVLLDPNLQDCYLPLGISCFQISDYEKAEQYLLKSLSSAGDNVEAHFYLGLIFKMKKDYDNAIKMFELAQKDRHFFVKSLYNIGEIHYVNEDFDIVIEELEKGLNYLQKNDEESHAYRYLLAEAYEQENKIDEAIHHWEKLAAENPDFRSVKIKLDSYREILDNKHMMSLFQSSLEELQPLISEIITGLQYNIIAKEKQSPNEYQYRAYNIKRINDPPLLIFFNRTTREITEGQILDFYRKINEEKCKSGIYISTSKFSLKAKSTAATRLIELYGGDYVNKAIEKIQFRRRKK
ncbi:MAG TPA: tetratricopeptide repeat protein [Spirochaetota bacterium]|nr:tetratricopeptide repeat protein [Spirochaetota bacterium]HPI89138.1 tetratricopeptide repeat protein [Spirochaetota bacterium]HPR48892.1 tetratricopeptide repeat protein [Spirochaetota bacterium]